MWNRESEQLVAGIFHAHRARKKRKASPGLEKLARIVIERSLIEEEVRTKAAEYEERCGFDFYPGGVW